MKNVLLIILMTSVSHESFGQMISINKDNMTTQEYSKEVTEVYTYELSLTPEQKKQTYITVLEKQEKLDSLAKNNIQVSSDILWTINTSLDRKYKEILTQRQYLDYERLQSKQIMRLQMVKADSIKSR